MEDTSKLATPPTVVVLPSGFRIPVRTGETLFEAAWRNGYTWPTRCLGSAQCTLCFVVVEDASAHLTSEIDDVEKEMIRRICLRGDGEQNNVVRLACRLKVSGDVVVQKDGVKMVHPDDGAN